MVRGVKIHISIFLVGRSLTTVFNVICSYLILGEKTSRESTICCLVIVLGFILGVNQEEMTGVFFRQSKGTPGLDFPKFVFFKKKIKRLSKIRFFQFFVLEELL